ncbi:hypothetical protein AAC387_Pa02g1379 [Persea americana]
MKEDWNKGRVKMRLDLKRGHCFFFVALLGVLFGCGTLSVAAISQCNGSIAQCYYQQESMMESEISGRLLGAVPNNYRTLRVLDPKIVLVPDLPKGGNKPVQARPYTSGCKDAYCKTRERNS